MGLFDKSSSSSTTNNDNSQLDVGSVGDIALADDVDVSPINLGDSDNGQVVVNGAGDNALNLDYSTTITDGGAFDLVEFAIGSVFSSADSVVDTLENFSTTQANTFQDALTKINQNVTSTLSGGQSEVIKMVMIAVVIVAALFAYKGKS